MLRPGPALFSVPAGILCFNLQNSVSEATVHSFTPRSKASIFTLFCLLHRYTIATSTN